MWNCSTLATWGLGNEVRCGWGSAAQVGGHWKQKRFCEFHFLSALNLIDNYGRVGHTAHCTNYGHFIVCHSFIGGDKGTHTLHNGILAGVKQNPATNKTMVLCLCRAVSPHVLNICTFFTYVYITLQLLCPNWVYVTFCFYDLFCNVLVWASIIVVGQGGEEAWVGLAKPRCLTLS